MAFSLFSKRLLGVCSVPITCAAAGFAAATANCEVVSDVDSTRTSTASGLNKVTEPFTGLEFPKTRSCSGSNESKCELVGTAVRCMMGRCEWQVARAYAVGMYVEDTEFLEKWRVECDKRDTVNEANTPESAAAPSDVSPSDESDRWYRLLDTETNANRTLVLLMDQDVKGEHIAHGFDRSMIKRVRARQSGEKQGPVKQALKKFTHAFRQQAMLHKGTQVQIVWTESGNLKLFVEDDLIADIESPELCEAVFDVYLGPESIFAKYKNTAFSYV